MLKVNVTAENLNGLLSNMLLLNIDLNPAKAKENLAKLHGAQDWESLVNSTDVAQSDHMNELQLQEKISEIIMGYCEGIDHLELNACDLLKITDRIILAVDIHNIKNAEINVN
jgi:hypothetical protein